MKDSFDVLIVGAGPSGGELARDLAAKGISVLLIDQIKRFSDNNFSSAAVPLKTIDDFSLDESVVGRYWRDIELRSSTHTHQWQYDQHQGAVLDFGRLREFLAKEATKNGAELRLGTRFISYESIAEGNIVTLERRDNKERYQVTASIVVDASGYQRIVLEPNYKHNPKHLRGHALEHVIKVDTSSDVGEKLLFFLGDRWCTNGYSWIFPMEPGLLKVGSACFTTKDSTPLLGHIKYMISECLDVHTVEVVDKHGGAMSFAPTNSDVFYNQRVIGIGDVVSTINPLGGEGIRHAMASSRIASKYIVKILNSPKRDFAKYRGEICKYTGVKWRHSELLARKVYGNLSDENIDTGVKFVSHLNSEQAFDVLFNYRFSRLINAGAKVGFGKTLRHLSRHMFSENPSAFR